MPSRRHQREAYTAKLALILIFLAGIVGFTTRPSVRRRHARRLDLPVTDLALLVSSTFRLGRLVALDQVFEPLRAPWTRTQPDSLGAGDEVVPRGTGARRALGELLSCPICAGTWISAALVYALHYVPGPTRIFMTIMGSVGLVEMLHALTEWLSWTGTSARKEVGAED